MIAVAVALSLYGAINLLMSEEKVDEKPSPGVELIWMPWWDNKYICGVNQWCRPKIIFISTTSMPSAPPTTIEGFGEWISSEDQDKIIENQQSSSSGSGENKFIDTNKIQAPGNAPNIPGGGMPGMPGMNGPGMPGMGGPGKPGMGGPGMPGMGGPGIPGMGGPGMPGHPGIGGQYRAENTTENYGFLDESATMTRLNTSDFDTILNLQKNHRRKSARKGSPILDKPAVARRSMDMEYKRSDLLQATDSSLKFDSREGRKEENVKLNSFNLPNSLHSNEMTGSVQVTHGNWKNPNKVPKSVKFAEVTEEANLGVRLATRNWRDEIYLEKYEEVTTDRNWRHKTSLDANEATKDRNWRTTSLKPEAIAVYEDRAMPLYE